MPTTPTRLETVSNIEAMPSARIETEPLQVP
jgi:hypothetical protein